MKILIATHNDKKTDEMKKILDSDNLQLVTLKDLGDEDDVIEDGQSFFENALIKASYFAKKHQITTISDDSGLEIYALNHRPGIFSARYSGKGDDENNLKVLKELEGVSNRGARFVSVIVVCHPGGTHQAYEGVIEGEILDHFRGTKGFGYDPIFYIPDVKQTFAEMDASLKNQISHRAIALFKLKEHLHEVINH